MGFFKGNKDNMGKQKPKTFNGERMNSQIERMPNGAPQMAALQQAIQQADAAQDHFWRLTFRYEYACEATFHDDPPKAMPYASEFSSIYEEHPDALPSESGAEAYLMITQIAIDPIANLPQIPFSQWEALMERYMELIKRYNVGLRTYWSQYCQFYQYVDKEKAYAGFQKFWKTGRDGLSDCRACERSLAVKMCLMMDDRAAAESYSKIMEQGRLRFCSSTPQRYWLYYLEYALDKGDLKEAEKRANALYRKTRNEKTDLSYYGAILRCFAFTDLERGAALLDKQFPLTVRMWDQKLVYDFYKGAWCFCYRLAKERDTISLDFSEGDFPIWNANGVYRCSELADWFYGQAKGIAERFDLRNGSNYFTQNLELAGKWLD
jgi:hypothetical protein